MLVFRNNLSAEFIFRYGIPVVFSDAGNKLPLFKFSEKKKGGGVFSLKVAE